jgi:hypothetical protein
MHKALYHSSWRSGFEGWDINTYPLLFTIILGFKKVLPENKGLLGLNPRIRHAS